LGSAREIPDCFVSGLSSEVRLTAAESLRRQQLDRVVGAGRRFRSLLRSRPDPKPSERWMETKRLDDWFSLKPIGYYDGGRAV